MMPRPLEDKMVRNVSSSEGRVSGTPHSHSHSHSHSLTVSYGKFRGVANGWLAVLALGVVLIVLFA
jgi:hypothetical protein